MSVWNHLAFKCENRGKANDTHTRGIAVWRLFALLLRDLCCDGAAEARHTANVSAVILESEAKVIEFLQCASQSHGHIVSAEALSHCL